MLHGVTKFLGLGPIGAKMTDFWNLDEASGATRMDSIVANASDMLVNGTVGTAVGPKGGADVAAAFTGITANFLSAAVGGNAGQNLDIPAGGGNHCMFGWCYFTNNSVQQYFAYRGSNVSVASTTTTHAMGITATPAVFGQNGGTSFTSGTQAAPAVSTWHFYVFWRDATDGKVRFQVDDGTIHVSVGPSNPTSQTATLFFGHGPAIPTFARMSRWGWIKGNILTDPEKTALYNGGPAGALSWADIVAMQI